MSKFDHIAIEPCVPKRDVCSPYKMQNQTSPTLQLRVWHRLYSAPPTCRTRLMRQPLSHQPLNGKHTCLIWHALFQCSEALTSSRQRSVFFFGGTCTKLSEVSDRRTGYAPLSGVRKCAAALHFVRASRLRNNAAMS